MERGFSAREVEKMLGLPAAEVRAWVKAGLLAPGRGARGELRFSFQDLVLLRTAKGLMAAAVPRARVRRALARLRAQLPSDRPLTGVHISAEGNRIVVRDGQTRWAPESGQALFDFGVDEIARQARALERELPSIDAARARARGDCAERAGDLVEGGANDNARDAAESADHWFEVGCALEDADRDAALAAYRRAVALDPAHADAHVNLGRLYHDGGDPAAAEACYRAGLRARPDDVTAAFNLGVALEDLGRLDEAVAAFEQAVRADPGLADAYYNLSRLCDRLGRRAEAIRYLQDYRKLTR